MKLRSDFVTNSSSSSFIIHNHTLECLTVADFLKENFDLVDQFNKQYKDTISHGECLISAERDYADIVLAPGNTEVVFGDEHGTTLGRVFDYILRDGGRSGRFSWSFEESLR